MTKRIEFVLAATAFALSQGCVTTGVSAPRTLQGIEDRAKLPMPAAPTARDESAWPPGLQPGSALSSDDAASLAIWNNKQLQADLATIGVARADLIDAGLLRNPRLDMLMPVGSKPFELLLNYPIEVFWQRRRRVAMATQAYEQLGTSLIQNGLNTVRDARLAHADLVLAKERLRIAKESLSLRSRIAELTDARLRAGDISELDAMAAKSERAAALEQLARLHEDVQVANERLRFAIGLARDGGAAILAVRADAVQITPPIPVSDLLDHAMGARADLKAAEIGINTAMNRAKWEHSRRFQLVSGQLSSKGIGTNGILTGPGLSLELPIFNRNQGLIARADADVEVAARQYQALKQRVAFEVQEARALLVQAHAGLEKLNQEVLPAFRRTADLAEQQYKNGDVAYLFVLEQSRGSIDAQLRLADAEAAVRRGIAQLERSVGSK